MICYCKIFMEADDLHCQIALKWPHLKNILRETWSCFFFYFAPDCFNWLVGTALAQLLTNK